MIRFNNVSFSYKDKKILKDFSLQISKGDRICLFGDSGIGKTTLIRLILGLEKPKKGEIIKENTLKPSVVFQEDRLLPFKSVLENITLFGANENTATKILTKLGLGEYLDKMPKELSGGMSRRVAIARALSVDFDFLILDEPFTGLDKTNIENTADIINSMLDDRPMIIITHDIEEARLLNCNIIEIKAEE